MQVHNDANIKYISQQGNQLKEGASYFASVKEKLPNQEAILQIKGQEVRVRYEGNMPSSGKVIAQMNDLKGELPVVKIIPNQVGSSTPTPASPTDGPRHAIQIVQQHGLPLTREMVQKIKAYMEKAHGTLEQKLETIALMARKMLEFTPQQIRAVHEGLHGSALKQVVQESLTSGPQRDPSLENVLKKLEQQITDPVKRQVVADMVRALQSGGDRNEIAQKIVRDFAPELHRSPQLAREVIFQLPNVVIQEGNPSQQNAASIIQQPQQGDLIQLLLNQVKKEPDFIKVLEKVRQELPQLQEVIAKAEQLHSLGRELAARQEIATALSQLVTNEPVQQPATEAETSYRFSQEFLGAIPIESRDLIVTTITKKLSQAAIDFKAVQRDITHALYTAEKLLQQTPSLARPSLETAIKQLDQAILKSDFMLYTDMGTEKKLLQASSQLHEARKLLAKGEHARASEIVQQVRSTVEKIIFQPSDQRVKHFVSKELLKLEEAPLQRQLERAVTEPLQQLRQEPTPRHALEFLRQLGLGHELETARRLASGQQLDANANLKEVLLKLAAEGQNSRAEQALQNITGQQLLSKPDSSGLQTLVLTLPLILREQVENVKVYMKSKQPGQKMDWENCSLYFLLETKRLGEVGIHLSAVDRNLSVTLKNDQPDFQQKMTNLVDKTKSRLEDIGYNISSIQFAKMTTETEKATTESQPKQRQPLHSETGYDFTV